MTSVEWPERKLGDVLTLKRGYDLPLQDRTPGDFPIVSSSGVTGLHAVPKVKGPGVVTGRYGTLGEVFYIREDFWPLNTSLYVQDFKGNDPRFVAYFLGYLDLGSRNTAGAVPGVNRNHLHAMVVHVPCVPEQRRIGALLAAYDDLIDNNLRRVRILEEVARALFVEWFVALRGPGLARPEDPQVLSDTWTTARLRECVEVNPKVVVPRDGEKPFVSMGVLSNDLMSIGEIEQRAGNSGSKFQNGDTLFARITPCLENGKTGFVQFLPDARSFAFGSTEFIVLRSKTLTPEFVYLLSRTAEFRGTAIKSMSGASGRQRVQERCFDGMTVVQPPAEILARFTELVRPMFRLIHQLHLTNLNLRATRDLLLPRLLSGQLSLAEIDGKPVREAESAVITS